MSLADNMRAAVKVATKIRDAVPNSSNTAWTSSPVISTGGVAPQTTGWMPSIYPWDRAVYAAHEYRGYRGALRDAAKRPHQLTCRLLHQM
ncbi:hypothetical protein [Aquabacterium sp.]|uniref:hypothetical protein n=1 Tax=Aquabacterium sp. TaxID=1872578 RepID=UPI002CCB8C15|nr:hypothetical protein [Aquabacterium sp.]HSW07134.1 hypothetical protein [Aquabacterium sp.]